MKVKILGSAAAECMPALWCECETCQYAREHGGKDVRRRTSYLIDDDILVDYGPDIFYQATEFNIDLRKVRRIFFTHSHEDHLNTTDLEWRRTGFSAVSQPVKVYGDEAVKARILNEWKNYTRQELTLAEHHLSYQVLLPGDKVEEEGLEVLALPAFHALSEVPLFYRFTRGGKTLLIANDTGYFPDRAWELLGDKKIDAMIIDCTGGIHPEYGHNTDQHLGAFTDAEIRQRLIGMGVLDETAPFVLNHFSHNAHSLHHEMVDLMKPQGITVGFDGLELNF